MKRIAFILALTALAGSAAAQTRELLLDSVPSECASPVLLIRNVAQRVWFAAGLPRLGDD